MSIPELRPQARSAAPRWRDSLAWQGVVALAGLFGLLLIGIVLVMNTYGKSQVVAESQGAVEEAGNRSVEEVQLRTREISALVKTIAETAAILPRDAATFTNALPRLIDFQGDAAVAGGGYWPEPGLFTPGVERRSFFWGRDPAAGLRYFDDYNAPPPAPGYHGEEWYVPVRFLPRGGVYWSRSYRDPHTGQAMVTCSTACYDGDRFLGAATIDLEFEDLAALLRGVKPEGAGYSFLLDRHNQFVAFPKPELLRRQQAGAEGARQGFVRTADLAAAEPGFRPIADAVQAMDTEIVRRAQASPAYVPSLAAEIDEASPGIERADAELVAAMLADPLRGRGAEPGSRLFSTVEVPADLITGQPAVAFLFHVPDPYWKLVFVVPKDELGQAASRISRSLLLLIAGILAAVLLPSYLFLSRRWIQPVTALAEAATLVRDGDLDLEISSEGRDEIAVLADSFNEMVGRLRANTESLQLANRDLERSLVMTDTILGTVREGLFLLNRELAVEPRYSTALESILGAENLAGASFLDLLRRIAPGKTYGLAERFLKLLFNPAKNDGVVGKINPLQELEAVFPGKGGQLERKYLSFTFDRIREGEEIRQAMVTVTDVTSRVELARQLKASQQRMERQAELLLSVMHVEPQMLSDFIASAHSELERVNSLLRAGTGEAPAGVPGEGAVTGLPSAERSAFYRRLAEQIYRSIHAIKGSAAMLRIDYFAAAAHRFESKLEPLRTHVSLDGNDFVPIVLELSEMIDSLVEVREVIGRVGELQQSLGSRPPAGTEVLEGVLERFVKDLAARLGKKAELRFEVPGDLEIPAAYRAPVQNVMAQLVRNSMAHGIEPAPERTAAGKPEQGQILVAARRNNGHLELLFRDDGRGIDYPRLIERARELAKDEPGLLEGLIDRERNRWKSAALDELIFHHGFSTAEEVSQDAGRGVGMSVVRETLRQLGGRISMRQRPGQFCEFHIALPITEVTT